MLIHFKQSDILLNSHNIESIEALPPQSAGKSFLLKVVMDSSTSYYVHTEKYPNAKTENKEIMRRIVEFCQKLINQGENVDFNQMQNL